MDTSHPPASRESRGITLMIASVVCFSATSILLAYISAEHGVSAWVASAYRAVIGILLVYLLQQKTGKVTLLRIVTRPLLFARGLIGGATIPLYYFCIIELGPGRAGMIGGSYPLFAALIASLALGERLGRSYFLYIGIALAGLAAVFSDNGLQGGKPAFDLLALGGAAAAGLCVVLMRHLQHSETTSNIFASQCVFTLLIGACTAGSEIILADPVALGLVLLASLTVIGGQLCITEAFRHIDVTRGSTVQMLTPALTVLASTALLGESFGLLELAGGSAILYASCRIVTAKR